MAWKYNLWTHLYETKPYKRLLKKELTWTSGKNKGFRTDKNGIVNEQLTGSEKAEMLEWILMEMKQLGPELISADIYEKSKSYKDIFAPIRRFCEFPEAGAHWKHEVHFKNIFSKTQKERECFICEEMNN
jgi:hypothetical protein